MTINLLGLPAAPSRCLATTNLIESPNAGMRLRTRRVTPYRDGKMILRLPAAADLDSEKHSRRIMGYESFWLLESALREECRASGDQPTATEPTEHDTTSVSHPVEAGPTPLPAVA